MSLLVAHYIISMRVSRVGQYVVDKVLGEGGMARVYLAHAESQPDTFVALKVARQSVNGAREAIGNEYQALRTLDHPSIVRTHELIEEGDILCMVCAVANGNPLSDCKDELLADQARAIEILKKFFSAMAHAGERGVVHSDLKPQNIIVDGSDITIIDFGLATGATTLTAEDIKDIKGTLDYLSPEQAEGRPLDIRSDIFSAGVIAYEILAGRKPFEASYDMATIYSILYEEPTPPSKINPAVTPVMDTVIMTMLAKSPDERFPSFATTLSEFETALSAPALAPAKLTKVVAIAPLSFNATDEDSRVLAEGLREDLIIELSKIAGLTIVSTVVLDRIPSAELTHERTRRDCGADFLLTGAVRRAGAQVRVTMSLVETEGAALIWSEKFDQPMTNLFDMQDMICGEISGALKIKLTGAAKAAPRERGTRNVEAYEYYLKGRSYLTRNTKEDMTFARQMFERAIEIDANYALAHASLADLAGSLYMNYYERTDEAWQRGVETGKRAIELDPSLPAGHRAYGRLLHLKGHYTEAIQTLLRAATLDAGYGDTYRTLAWACEGQGDLEQSLAWARKALTIDSHSEETILLQGIIQYDLGNQPQAINAFSRCLELRPDYGRAHYFLGKCSQRLGRFETALKSYELASKFGGDPNTLWDHGWLLMGLGRKTEAIRLLDDACREQTIEFAVRFYLGYAQFLNGETNTARGNFIAAQKLSQDLIDTGDRTGYPMAIMALAHAALGEAEKADEWYQKAAPPAADDGELANWLARYCAMRGMKEALVAWIEISLSHRLGISNAEAMIDPFFEQYRDLIPSAPSKSAAA